MAGLIQRHGPPALRRTRNAFASLGSAIISQQLSGAVVRTIRKRFVDLYGNGRFPTPQALLDTPFERLRGVGLSRAKVASLLDLAQKFVDGTVRPKRFSHMEEAEIASELCQVRGIGPWSVHMFLIFGLLRPDVLPVGDLGVQKGVQAYFGLRNLPDARTMEAHTIPWRPYRSIGSWYMWRLLEESRS